MAIFSHDKNVIDNNHSKHLLGPNNNTQVSDDFLPVSYRKVFYYNHVPQSRTSHDAIPYQKICSALSNIPVLFNEELVFSQFWAAIDFGYDTHVLTTRGQPFGFSMYTNGFWYYRLACLDHNAYVNQRKGECIGLPGRVFHNLSPEWIQDVWKYKDKDYPQRQDAMLSNIRGSFAIPVFDGGPCIGVLEFVMTNGIRNFLSKMEEVCEALKKAGLQSSDPNKCINIKEADLQLLSDQNENINVDTSQTATRKRKTDSITRDGVTKLLGLPKLCAAKRYEISENTFSKVHKKYGIDRWPCKANNTVKSSAHSALIDGIASEISSDEALQRINSKLMNDDIIRTLEQADSSQVDEYMDSLISTVKRTTFKNVCKRVRIYELPSSMNVLGYSDDSSFYMDTDTTFVLPHEETTNAKEPIPQTQIDQVAGIKTRLFPTPVDPLADINSDDWLTDMVTDTNEFSCKQTTNGRASVPETRIDEIAGSNTSSLQIPVGIREDNGFSDNCLSDTYTDNSTFELRCEQTIYDRVYVPETQIYQTAASETRPSESPVYDRQNTTNLFDNRDIMLCENQTSVSEAHINQNAPDVTWNIEFGHRGAGFMQECDELIYQGWYGPLQSNLRVT